MNIPMTNQTNSTSNGITNSTANGTTVPVSTWDTSQPGTCNRNNDSNNSSILCPVGYICDPGTNLKAYCQDIRQKYIDFGFGDVLAGSYCPAKNYTKGDYVLGKIESCSLGSYCPTPETNITCPKGYFCPHKSIDYTAIPCNACPTGSTIFRRDKLGTALFFAALVLAAVYLFFSLFMTFTTRGRKIRNNLENRRIDAAKRNKLMEEEKARLLKIRPFLENIVNKLNVTTTDVFNDGMSGLSFNAEKLFDLLDINHDKVLSFDELNKVLQLKDTQLKQFIRRMNEMDEENICETSVSRNTFVAHFLNASYHSVNFDPSPEEVSSLYDMIQYQQNENITHHSSGIDIDELYESELSVFLSDLQIYNVIKYFKDHARNAEPQAPLESNKEKVQSNQNTAMTSMMTTSKDFIGEAGELDLELGDDSLNLGGSKRSITPRFISSSTADSVSNKTMSTSKKFRSMYVSMSAIKKLNSTKNGAVYTTVLNRKGVVLNKDEFIRLYPEALFYATRDQASDASEGVDVQFHDLSLHIKAGMKSSVVVDHVTGRIRKKSMSALMGGSGAGKTSLLNALCGRAFYGEVSGSIKINGQDKQIKEIADSIGFVPQDDIVFAELTVKENLMFAGKFRLPVGTSPSEIEAIANEALVNLGLVRIANSMVGDVTRRGVSGGEKKRVNIGLELMAKPSILFLDEPTSGLDSSSAMLVMKALRVLVERQGVTVCSVIHQPRAFIFNLFDAVLLLGVGGRMVYHGPTREALSYFTNLGYTLPEGESVADWLMDISSGQLARSTVNEGKVATAFTSHPKLSPVKLQGDTAALARNFLYDQWSKHFNALAPEKKIYYEPPMPYPLPSRRKKANFLSQLKYHLQRNLIISKRNASSKVIDTIVVIGGVIIASLLVGQLKLTSGSVPPIENEFLLYAYGDINAYDFALRIMFATVANITDCVNFATIVAALVGTLLALCSIKILTEKREEFFREAGSGYNILSYFLAVNIYTLFEQGIQAIFASLVALWLRNSVCKWWMYVINFVVLTWGAVSWALLFAILVPPKNIVLMTSFFMVISALMLSGVSVGVKYKEIYMIGNEVLAYICGILSPARYFVEMMVVSEYRALGPQYGFTIDSTNNSSNFTQNDSMYVQYNLGRSDFSRYWNSTLSDLGSTPSVFQKSENGWYWGVPAAIFAGLSIRILGGIAILTMNRAKQIKEPIIRWSLNSNNLIKLNINVADKSSLCSVIGLSCILIGSLIISGYFKY